MISRGGPAIGALIMGWASDYVGLRWPVFVGALCCLALWLWALTRQRAMAAALEGEADET
jgi:predicted MFS family arabinose efflux permease